MKVQHIIGADLSKGSIDLVYHLSKTHIKINNSIDGFNDLIRWLQKLNINISKTMIVMEHTGLFARSVLLKLKNQLAWSAVRQISWMLPGLLSMAMKRKTDSWPISHLAMT
jgi:hypothetical protein